MKPSARTIALRELLHRERQGQILDGEDLFRKLQEALESEETSEVLNRLVGMSEDLDRLNWAPYHMSEIKTHLDKIEKMIPEECR